MDTTIRFGRILSHIIFRARINSDKIIREISEKTKNKNILEIGSGKKVDNEYCYSYKKYFEKNNRFLCSDVNREFGHRVIDITDMDIKNKFDMIICLNVLEHVYDYQKAVDNLQRALKKGGELIVFIPYLYPLHDTPHDYFRFSEYALRRVFSKFTVIEIKHFGMRKLPTGYYIRLVK